MGALSPDGKTLATLHNVGGYTNVPSDPATAKPWT